MPPACPAPSHCRPSQPYSMGSACASAYFCHSVTTACLGTPQGQSQGLFLLFASIPPAPGPVPGQEPDQANVCRVKETLGHLGPGRSSGIFCLLLLQSKARHRHTLIGTCLMSSCHSRNHERAAPTPLAGRGRAGTHGSAKSHARHTHTAHTTHSSVGKAGRAVPGSQDAEFPAGLAGEESEAGESMWNRKRGQGEGERVSLSFHKLLTVGIKEIGRAHV